jgi:signal transduction histidine kinase
MLEDKPVELVTEVSSDLPLIRADKQRVRQIILNLMSNACKFTETGTIVLQAHPQDDSILVAVKDTGPGIPPEDQTSIFEPFQQTQVGLKKGGGTGLGLTISRRLAEAHGGALWVESIPGQGATFYVKLPLVSVIAPTLAGEK